MADYHIKLPTGEEYDVKGAADDADPMQLLTESLGKSGESKSAPEQTPEPASEAAPSGRGVLEQAKEYVPGLQGVTDLARLAGHISGVVPMSEDDWRALADRGRQQEAHPIATGIKAAGDLASVAIPGMRPLTAAGAGAGIALENATGSPTAGRVASIAAPLVVGGVQGARRLMKGNLRTMVGTDVGAGTTAEEAGNILRTPQQGARKAIGSVSDEASAQYQAAQAHAEENGLMIPGDQAERLGISERPPPPAAPAAPKPSGLLDASGRPIPAPQAAEAPAAQPAPDVSVAQAIEHHSLIGNRLRRMRYDDPGRAAVVEQRDALDSAITDASRGTPVEHTWRRAQKYYREVAAPVKKTANKALTAETPEQAARGITSKRMPTRFERIAEHAPEATKPLRSAVWTDALDNATIDGKLDMKALSAQLPKDPKAMAQWATTPAQRNAVKAIHLISHAKKGGGALGAIAGGSGGFVVGGVSNAIGGGYVGRKIVEAALNSQAASRALYRLSRATIGSPGWKLAAKALTKLSTPAGASGARAGSMLPGQEEE